MITPLDFFADLFNPSLAFLPRALAAVLLASVVTGVVGCHVLMRGMVFIGDAVAHSVFPGLAVAFVLGGNLMVGGLTAGVVTAILVAILVRISGCARIRSLVFSLPHLLRWVL